MGWIVATVASGLARKALGLLLAATTIASVMGEVKSSIKKTNK